MDEARLSCDLDTCEAETTPQRWTDGCWVCERSGERSRFTEGEEGANRGLGRGEASIPLVGLGEQGDMSSLAEDCVLTRGGDPNTAGAEDGATWEGAAAEEGENGAEGDGMAWKGGTEEDGMDRKGGAEEDGIDWRGGEEEDAGKRERSYRAYGLQKLRNRVRRKRTNSCSRAS